MSEQPYKPEIAPAARERSRSIPSAIVIVLYAASAALAVLGLVRGLAHRVPLVVLWGPLFWIWTSAAAASAVGAVLATARTVRSFARGAPVASARSLRVAFCLAVLGIALYLACFQPFQRLYAALYGAVWAGVLAGGLALGSRTRGAPAAWSRVLDVLAFGLCAAALGAELALAGLARWRPSQVLAQPRRSAAQYLADSRFRPGRLHLGTPVNSRGFYDEEFQPKAPGQHLVVSIADSFGASSVPLAYHFTTVAERLTKHVVVHNFGVGGIGPPEYLQLLCFEALPLDPDALVLNIFVGNDIAFAGAGVREEDSFLRAWLDPNYVYLVSVPKRIARIRREREEREREAGAHPSRDAMADDRARGAAPGEPGARTSGASDVEHEYPWVLDPLLEPPTFSKSAFLDNQRVHALDVAAGGEEVFGPFFEVLDEIVRQAGSLPLCVVLIPEEFQVEDDLWAEVRAVLPGIELERDRAQRLIGAWLSARGVSFIDLLPRLRAVEPLEDGRRHVYLLRDTHFNVRGNRIAGEALAEWIRKTFPETP